MKSTPTQSKQAGATVRIKPGAACGCCKCTECKCNPCNCCKCSNCTC